MDAQAKQMKFEQWERMLRGKTVARIVEDDRSQILALMPERYSNKQEREDAFKAAKARYRKQVEELLGEAVKAGKVFKCGEIYFGRVEYERTFAAEIQQRNKERRRYMGI